MRTIRSFTADSGVSHVRAGEKKFGTLPSGEARRRIAEYIELMSNVCK
jgi:hypothetical protein